jgi:hypothetical protein
MDNFKNLHINFTGLSINEEKRKIQNVCSHPILSNWIWNNITEIEERYCKICNKYFYNYNKD